MKSPWRIGCTRCNTERTELLTHKWIILIHLKISSHGGDAAASPLNQPLNRQVRKSVIQLQTCSGAAWQRSIRTGTTFLNFFKKKINKNRTRKTGSNTQTDSSIFFLDPEEFAFVEKSKKNRGGRNEFLNVVTCDLLRPRFGRKRFYGFGEMDFVLGNRVPIIWLMPISSVQFHSNNTVVFDGVGAGGRDRTQSNTIQLVLL